MSTAREIEERAALWVLRREECYWSADEQEELDRWLAESDAHKAAFWRLEHGWREADRIARRLLRDGAPEPATVLLSPAAASFDMFVDYAARGRAFKTAVASIASERRGGTG